MVLADWLEQQQPPMTNKVLAATLGVSEESARLWRAGLRRPSPRRVKLLEQLTKGLVTLDDLTQAYEQSQKETKNGNACR